ncbi:very short patch repair endonuclease [Brachybacterium paraconglomeratum]|uniref:very short patch repair endonuclease n=1 Tax=Brachybacterium paraconglomeratum TaxID=173362 RepID=UPI003FD17CAB
MSPGSPPPSSEGARRTILANRRSNTEPELRVRRLLHAAGLRYRTDYAPDRANLRRRADIVFTRRRVAVFIDGCYWHGCPEHFVPPKANAQYWAGKIAANMARDRDTVERLRNLGWVVLRFWEHEEPALVAEQVILAVRSV